MKHFCWERMITGIWSPVFYADKPNEEKLSKGDRPSRSVVIPVDDDTTFEQAAMKLPKPVW